MFNYEFDDSQDQQQTSFTFRSPNNVNNNNQFYQPASFTGLEQNAPFNQQPSPQHTFNSHHVQPSFPYNLSPHSQPPVKRSRETFDDEQDIEPASDTKDGPKIKPGACFRCKNLKVKCEFITESEPCKRCASGGHECYIPGRKKRRTPPKREDLLNQIKDQASQIQDLMAQLESCGKKLHRRGSSVASSEFIPSSSGLESPILTPPPSSLYSHPDSDLSSRKAIEDWISKAKQSLQDFDVFIGAGMPKRYIVQDVNDSDDEFFSAIGTDEYGIAVENPDGEEIPAFGAPLRHRASLSSMGSRKHAIELTKPAIIPNEEVPFGLFGQLSLENARPDDGVEAEEEKQTGIAGKDFFLPSPSPQVDQHLARLRHAPPILTRKIITTQEAESLFQIYFDNINLSVSLLDPVLYTPHTTFYRSPFLFTVICAISSRFYFQRPELYSQLMHYALQAAGWALINGAKNVEMCAAYILLSLYPEPKKKWEDQRGWLFLGLAIRAATDLNLNLPITAKFTSESHAREMLNRTRIWLNCFNLDRSTGSQHGKPPIICINDYMAKNSENWWKSSPYNMKNFDIHICAYNAELQVMGKFLAQIHSNSNTPTGFSKDAERIATETDEELKQLQSKWSATLKEADVNDPQGSFRTGLLTLAYPYARLIALSYGFQHAFGKGTTTENPFLTRCMEAAFDVVVPVLEDLCRPSQRIYLRHGPEAQSVFITFASAFLVKLLQPKFSSFLSLQKRHEIRQLVQRVVDLLGSNEIAIDDRHGPKLYSKFLRNLLAAPMARVEPVLTPPAPGAARKQNLSTLASGPEHFSSLVAGGAGVSSHESNLTAYDHSSPPRNTSLSPPARAAALSFNNFAPSGGLDPFAPEFQYSNALYFGNNTENGNDTGGGVNAAAVTDFFHPPLPGYDEALLQRMQLLSGDTSLSWQDSSLSSVQGHHLSWEGLQQALDIRVQDPSLYNEYFMTGP